MPKNSQLIVDLGQGLAVTVGLSLITSWKTKERPKKAKKGTFGFNSQTNSLEYWSGSFWYTVPMSSS